MLSLPQKQLLQVFAVALTLRMAVVIGVSLFFGGTLFLDDLAYLEAIRAFAAGEEPGQYWYQVQSFIRPLGWLASAVGSHPVVLLATAAVAGSVTASMVTFILLGHVQRRVAVGAGLLVAIYPSQVLWSSLLLRDAFVWMALSLVGACLTVAFSGRALPWRFLAIAAIPLLWWYIAESRTHTFLVVVLATLAAFILSVRRHRLWLVAAAISLGVVAPWVAGFGPAGLDIIRQGTAGREIAREGEVASGATTIDCIAVPFLGKGEPERTGWRNDFLCAPSGLRLMLLDPFPNQLSKSRMMIPAFTEHLLWYPLLALAALGVIRTRLWRPDITYVAVVGAGLIVMWALIDRNFGTAYRHRGEFLWALVVLAALGFQQTVMPKINQRSGMHGGSSCRSSP